MEFTGLLALGTLVFAFVNFLKYARVLWRPEGGDDPAARKASQLEGKNGMFTQIVAWASGVGGVFLAGTTQFAKEIQFGSQTLASMNGWSKVFVGLIATSILTTFNEAKKAVDNNDSAKTPTMLRGADQSAKAKVSGSANGSKVPRTSVTV